MKIRALLKTIGLCGAAMLLASNLLAVPLPSNHLLGSIDPGTPASDANEPNMVNFLVNAYNSGTPTGTNLGDNPADPGPENYTLLYTGGVIPNPAPLASGPGSKTEISSGGASINLTGTTYQWLLTKYGEASYVYYIGDLSGIIDIAATGLNQNGLSHYTLFNGTPTTRVPDGGSTVLFLGTVLAGFGIIRRQLRK